MFHNLSTGPKAAAFLRKKSVIGSHLISPPDALSFVDIWPHPIRSGLKPGRTLQESKFDGSGWAVTLFADDEFGHPIQLRIVRLIYLFAEDEGNHVGVLLNRSRFAQVCKLRAVVASPTTFGSAAQLRQRHDRDAQFFRQTLQAARDSRDFLGAVFVALAAAGHELQVIDDNEVQRSLRLQKSPCLGAHFADSDTRGVIDENRCLAQLL